MTIHSDKKAPFTRISRREVDKLRNHLVDNKLEMLHDIESGKLEMIALEREIDVFLENETFSTGNKYQLIKKVKESLFGYGPLEDYVRDPDISDIDVLSYGYMKFRKSGVLHTVLGLFEDEKHFEEFCRLVAVRNSQVINESSPSLRFTDTIRRLRINIVFPPRNSSGHSMFIRKQADTHTSLAELYDKGMFDEESYMILSEISSKPHSIMIAGKSGAGKTTLLRALLNNMSEENRILVMEREKELFASNRNFISMKIDSREDIFDLVRDGLTLSVDGFCFGEITGREVWELLVASQTDHKVIGTIHASKNQGVVSRIASLVADRKENLTFSDTVDFIGTSLEYVVYMRSFKVEKISRFEDGKEVDVYDSIWKKIS